MPWYNNYNILYIGVLAAFVLSLCAQGWVKSAYGKYSGVFSSCGMSGAQVARSILDANGCGDVAIELSQRGTLSDHYDPRDNTLRLSQGVYDSASIAAYGIAAHEAGHAIQHAQGYIPIKLRSALVPVANVGSQLAVPLVMLGFLLSISYLALAGAYIFFFVVVFQLVTLPVEFNASARAMRALDDGGYLSRDELSGARRVLTAAAMTYVASLLLSLLQWLRLMSLANRRKR